jgi:hypothetical protein
METTINRSEQFKSDIGEMRLKTGTSSKEGGLQLAGALLMVAGIVLGIVSYFSSTNQGDVRDQNELILLGLVGVSLTLTGGAMFLRYSLAKFFRLWLLRQMYEGQSHIDQVVGAIRDRG